MSTLYESLLDLVQSNPALYYQDYGNYRVFNYRLARYSDFLAPNALEARGITFYIPNLETSTNPNDAVLVSRPFKKFFNLGENPFTIGLDTRQENCIGVWEKEDGSMISSYIDVPTGQLRLKSKQNLYSAQSNLANEIINRSENIGLRHAVYSLALFGLTIIFELVSPANRIVLEYPKTELRLLGARSNSTGVTYSPEEVVKLDGRLAYYSPLQPPFISPDLVPKMTGIEGYVYTFLRDGEPVMTKVKTDWYISLHHLKDSVNTPRRLYEAIIFETIDDVKNMFATDPYSISRIEHMESKVIPLYNDMISKVETYHRLNKDLSRKDYAIKGQAELGPLFSLGMNAYLGKPAGYQEFAIKHMSDYFGISASDDPYSTEDS